MKIAKNLLSGISANALAIVCILSIFAGSVATLALCCNSVEAQQQTQQQTVSLSSLTAQGFEIKAAVMLPVPPYDSVVFLQKGKDVFVCTVSPDGTTRCVPLH